MDKDCEKNGSIYLEGEREFPSSEDFQANPSCTIDEAVLKLIF